MRCRKTERARLSPWPALLLGIAAVSAGLVDRREGRVLVALAAALVAAFALLFSHWSWSITGEGGRVLYALAAIAALTIALPLRSADRRLRAASWLVVIVLIGSSLILTRGAVERRVEAGAEMRALVSVLAKTADATPDGSYAFVIVPDRIGSIPFARNAQGGLMSPPVQPRPLSTKLMVQLEDALPGWPALFEQNAIGRLKSRAARRRGRAVVAGHPRPVLLLEHAAPRARRDAARLRAGPSRLERGLGEGPRRRGLPRMIALNDLARHHAPLRAELEAAMARVHARGWYILGPEVEAFEREFAAFVGAAECVAVGNGTDALELALRALAVGPGDAVATVANAGMYATTAIRAAAARPAYVEVDASTLLMDPAALAAGLDAPTRAVVVTHLYGRMADVDRLGWIARERGIALIEDCAQAHGAKSGGRAAGTAGTLGCYSFYPTKNLGALGDAGAIVTSDRDLAAKLRALRTYGWGAKYHCAMEGGMNSRMDELQAAVLRAKLPHLDGWNRRRREIAAQYAATIRHPAIVLPAPAEDGGERVASLRGPREGSRIAARASRRVGCRDRRPLSGARSPAAGRRPRAARRDFPSPSARARKS